jgi:diaminohydroxyphosphoribosylaminopyrimidine deaminase / 5-amino-6-(5-phosphoribosylamino)uracil reductase
MDPNPQVSGRGIERLQAHGIHVDWPCLEAEATKLNQEFFDRMASAGAG